MKQKQLKMIFDKYRSMDFSKVSMPKIMFEIRRDFPLLPFTTAMLRKGGTIERARINKPGEIFISENELSYRTDITNLKSFGRANLPHESLFYGSVVSNKIKNPRIVNLFETEESFRSADILDKDFILTVGKWRIIEDFEVAEIVSNKTAQSKNPNVKMAFDFHSGKMIEESSLDPEIAHEILEFFSDEFAKKDISGDYDYKISAAYANLAAMRGLNGVCYPSVRTDYEGINVAINISAVEQYLKLEIAGMFRVKKLGKNSVVDNAYIAEDLGSMNSKFAWKKAESLSEEDLNKLLTK